VIKASAGERLDALIHRLFPFLFVRRLNPDVLTVCGALLSVASAAAFGTGWIVTGGVLILVSGFFDLVDGVVARHHGISTRFGAFLDATLDRFTDMALLVGIAVHFAVLGRPDLVLLTGVALMAGVLVSYSKARAELVLESFDVGLIERGERIGILAAGAILGFLVIALWILAIGSTITVIQRFAAARREMEHLDRSESGGLEEPTP
jgi:phosphatidylglycerophosphate synthase